MSLQNIFLSKFRARKIKLIWNFRIRRIHQFLLKNISRAKRKHVLSILPSLPLWSLLIFPNIFLANSERATLHLKKVEFTRTIHTATSAPTHSPLPLLKSIFPHFPRLSEIKPSFVRRTRERACRDDSTCANFPGGRKWKGGGKTSEREREREREVTRWKVSARAGLMRCIPEKRLRAFRATAMDDDDDVPGTHTLHAGMWEMLASDDALKAGERERGWVRREIAEIARAICIIRKIPATEYINEEFLRAFLGSPVCLYVKNYVLYI